jgi:rhodanese-related sulfurtransferase
VLIDVRSRREYERGHVPGATHLPFWRAWRVPLPAGRDEPVTLYCGHGPRAWMAGVVLRARGMRRVGFLAGHMRAWRRSGKPLE